jgi:histidinol-phosphate aminotransferase
MNAAGMEQMVKGLTAFGLAPIPSEANFVYVDVGRDGRALFEAMLREGIIVRHIEGPMIRVTIGLEEENKEFLAALKRVIHSY